MEESQREVVVVSLDNYSFDTLMKKKFYAFPKGSRKVGKYFAFYKNGEINYYAEVKTSEEGGKTEVGTGYWLYCLADATPPFQIVRFDKIIKLKNPIKKDDAGKGRGHVQGRIYTTLKKFLKAKTIKDLS